MSLVLQDKCNIFGPLPLNGNIYSVDPDEMLQNSSTLFKVKKIFNFLKIIT